MQDTNAKSRMRMVVRLGLAVSLRVSMGVQMDVPVPVVLMLVCMDFEGFRQSPAANSDQHHPYHSFSPARKEVDGNQVSQQKRQQTDNCHTGRMA